MSATACSMGDHDILTELLQGAKSIISNYMSHTMWAFFIDSLLKETSFYLHI